MTLLALRSLVFAVIYFACVHCGRSLVSNNSCSQFRTISNYIACHRFIRFKSSLIHIHFFLNSYFPQPMFIVVIWFYWCTGLVFYRLQIHFVIREICSWPNLLQGFDLRSFVASRLLLLQLSRGSMHRTSWKTESSSPRNVSSTPAPTSPRE